METIRGTYINALFFNPEKGQSTFLLKPAEGTCKEYISKAWKYKNCRTFLPGAEKNAPCYRW